MNQRYKPQGYSSVSVYVIADGAQRVINFLTETLDAKPLRRFDLPDGSIMHAEIQIDDTVIMIADSGSAFPSKSRIRKKAVSIGAPVSKTHPATHGGSPLRWRNGKATHVSFTAGSKFRRCESL